MVAAPASNAEFLNGIFGTLPTDARPTVCGFPGHPETGNWTAHPWQPGAVVDGPGLNWYFTIAVHRPGADGAYQRKGDVPLHVEP